MKAFHKALVVTGLCVSMALGVTGCAGKTLDGSKTVATVGEKTMTLGEANFLLRYEQVQIETYYETMLGDGVFGMDLYGDGSTFGAHMKDDIMTQMYEYYILEDKAAEYGVELTEEETTAITEAATAFLAANGTDVQEQMTADQATVERVLTLMTIGQKTANAICATADVTVSDEDAAQRGFSYISISKGSDEEALTDDEIQANKELLTAVAASVASGNTLDAAAVEQGLTASTGSYGKDYTSSYDDALIAALDALSEGEVSDVIETDTYLYLAQLTAELDEEATASRKATLIQNAQSEYYEEVMAAWKEAYPLTVVEAVWDDVVFDRSYELVE